MRSRSALNAPRSTCGPPAPRATRSALATNFRRGDVIGRSSATGTPLRVTTQDLPSLGPGVRRIELGQHLPLVGRRIHLAHTTHLRIGAGHGHHSSYRHLPFSFLALPHGFTHLRAATPILTERDGARHRRLCRRPTTRSARTRRAGCALRARTRLLRQLARSLRPSQGQDRREQGTDLVPARAEV